MSAIAISSRRPASRVASLPFSQVQAGLLATLMYVFGPVSLYFATARAFTGDQVAASGFVVAFSTCAAATAILSIWSRQPVAMGWSLPGLVFMASAAQTYSLEEIAGAALVASLAVLLLAATGVSARVERLVPLPVAMAMLAGSTLPLCARPFAAMGDAPLIVAPVFAAFILASRAKHPTVPPAVIAVLVGLVPALLLGPHVHSAEPGVFPALHPLALAFSPQAIVSLAPPLALFALIANAQGRVVLAGNGFEPPSRGVGMASGMAGMLHSVFGAPPSSLQRVALAILSGDSAGAAERRWIAAVTAAAGCLAIAWFAAPLEAFTGSLDPAYVTAVSGLLVLKVFADALTRAVSGPSLAGPLTLCVAMSGLTLAGLSTEFWALLLGCAVALGEGRPQTTTPALRPAS